MNTAVCQGVIALRVYFIYLSVFIDLNPLVQALSRSYPEVLFLALFRFTHQWGKRCSQERFRPCYSQSQVVYSYSVDSRVCWPKYHFGHFFWPDIKIVVGVVISMHLKHSPDYIDSTYIWVHGSISLGSRVMAEIPFLTFLTLHKESRRCGQVGPS